MEETTGYNMDIFKFIVRKSDQGFEAIIKQEGTEITSADPTKYSALISDEQTARANFTLTGHLPNERFEELLKEAKG